MKQEIIHSLTNDFESFANKTDDGLEFWFARDLQHLLGYSKWENFSNVISKAKTACELSEHNIDDHFPDIRKLVSIGSGAEKEKFKNYCEKISMKLITNQIVIWAKQLNLSFWK